MRKQRALFTLGAILAYVAVFHVFTIFLQTDPSSTVYIFLLVVSAIMCATFVYAGMVWQQILIGIEDVREMEKMKDELENVEVENNE